MKQKKKLSVKTSLLLIVIFSLVITEFMLISSAATKDAPFQNALLVFSSPTLFFLNFFPVILFLLLIFSIFNNAALSMTFSSLFFAALSIINRLKISMRQDPLIPTDFTLVTEIFALLDKFGFTYVISVILFLIVSIILIVAFSVKFKSENIGRLKRIIFSVILLIIAFSLNNTIYSDKALYDKFPVEGSYYFKVNHYKSKGFLYSFIKDFNTINVQKPEGYNKENYIFENTNTENYSNSVKPHVIMIMSEAFSDLSENKNLDFSKYGDPLKNFKELSKSDNAVSGHITVPNFGGGTADTEFDVLTGLSTSLIDNDLTSYMFVNKEIDGLCASLERIGYNSLAIHPGYPWFYNRQNVYKNMGFDDFLHLENAFDLENDSVAGYIKEEATTKKIKECFENHIETSQNPFFEFCVTIENHGPFDNKYGITKNFKTNKNITDSEQNILSNYFNGVKKCDIMLKELTDYFNSINEPVVIIFFGDHLPGFPGQFELLKKLEYDMDIDGTTEQRLNLYKTPFIIWQNDYYKNINNIKQNLENIPFPENHTISASYLGTTTMELIGFKNLTPFISYKNNERSVYPVIEKRGIMDVNSKYFDNIPEEKDTLKNLKEYIYYKLFDEDLY